MKTRIYVVDNDSEISLVKATGKVTARNHVAKASIGVRLATQEDLVHYLSVGLPILQATPDDEPPL